jgi:hypothetical protein
VADQVVSTGKPNWVLRVKTLAQKVQEPYSTTWFQFVIYVSTAFAGVVAFLSLPIALEQIVGHTMVSVFGVIGFSGSLISMIAILPGIHWFERVGIILLLTSLGMYVTMMLYLDGVPISLCMAVALGLSLGRRLYDIRH